MNVDIEMSGRMTMSEFIEKQKRIQTLLAERGLDAVWLRRVSSFAWVTCGASGYVNTATTDGAVSALITPSGRYIITNNIEATRLGQEEKLAEQGWEFRIAPWHTTNPAIAELTRGLNLGVDGAFPGATDLSVEFTRARANLLPEEGERFRALGRLCADAMESAIRAVQPGQSEYEIAAWLARETQARGVQPIVNLIATDDRIFKFRHPLPTDKKLERYAMLVLGGRKWGLCCSITRLIHFGKLPDEVRRKTEACARVDATFITATRPGQVLGNVFERAMAAYAETGFADEWQLHHQGGATGYEPREFTANPSSKDLVTVGQAYAWNPSITGAKSEDTILVGANGNEVLTTTNGLPTVSVKLADGATITRPAILEIV
jgi:Xaa-Pro aminopeptidase